MATADASAPAPAAAAVSAPKIRASLEALVAAWNEHDSAKRMQLIEVACADDVTMRTPHRIARGRAELHAFMGAFQQRSPNLRAAFSSAIDIQGAIFRYTGVAIDTNTGKHAGQNFEAGEATDDGRIQQILSFIGDAKLPALGA